MKDRILMIIPTRDRNEKHKELFQSFLDSELYDTDLLFVLDNDNASQYELINHESVKYLISNRIRMIPSLNYAANLFSNEFKYIGFMGDDHRFRTQTFDNRLIKDLGHKKDKWIWYGNDLLQQENLPTAVIMTSNIIKTLGYMVPPKLIHLFADNFWKDLGNELGILHYDSEVVIEHMHYTTGKSEQDSLYTEVNSHTMFNIDKASYEAYKMSQFPQDILKFYR